MIVRHVIAKDCEALRKYSAGTQTMEATSPGDAQFCPRLTKK